MIELIWLSHQYFSRYGPSKFELRFSLTTEILQQPPKKFDFWYFQICCHWTEMNVNQIIIGWIWFDSSCFLRSPRLFQVLLYPLNLLISPFWQKISTHPSKTLSIFLRSPRYETKRLRTLFEMLDSPLSRSFIKTP